MGIDAVPDDIAAEMRAWYSYPLFLGMGCHDRQVSEQLSATLFYPEPGELQQRFSALEADSSPILEAVKDWYSYERFSADRCAQIVPHVLNEMRGFVHCYEEAVAKKTDWRPWLRLVINPEASDEVIIHMQEEHEAISGQFACRSGEHGEESNVMFGDPHLMVEAADGYLEIVDGDRHRKPYIMLW